jgi:predicted PurR-regulated permease PerM
MDTGKEAKLEITPKTLLLLVGLLVAAKLVVDVKGFFFALFIALIFSSILKQPISFLENKKIHKRLAAFLVFFGVFVGGAFILSGIVPPIVDETALFSRSFPHILSSVERTFPSLKDTLSTLNIIPTVTQQIVGFVSALFSNTVFFISIIFMTIYLSLDPHIVQTLLSHLFPHEKVEKIDSVVIRIEKRLGMWMVGELILMTVVGLLTYIGLTLIRIPYSLPLALIAGLLEVVPNIGPITAEVPAFFVGITLSPLLGLYTIFVAVIVQQLENHLIVPLVMKKVTGFHPIATLFFLVVGGTYAGVLGVILAIPLALVVLTIVEETHLIKKPSG